MSLVLNGSNYAQVTAQPIAAKPFTLAAWFKSTSDSALQSIFAYSDAGSDIFIVQARGAIGGDPVAAMEYDGAWKIADTSSGYTANTWHLAVVTFVSDTERNSFIDGGSKGTNTESQSADIDTGVRIYVGTHNGSSGFFSGKIGYVAMWSAELSDANIALLANGSLPSDIESGSLEGYWPLVDDYVDLSTNENDLAGAVSPTFDDADNPPVDAAEFVELSGAIAAQSAVSGNLVVGTAVELSGTIAAVSTVSGNLGSTTVGITVETSYIKRLIVAGNDQFWYESI